MRIAPHTASVTPNAPGARPSTTPALVATPLPPLKRQRRARRRGPNTATMSSSTEPVVLESCPGAEDCHWRRALERVEYCHQEIGRISSRERETDHRRTERSAADRAQVDAPGSLRDEVRRRNGAEEIRGQDRDDTRRRGHSLLPRRLIFKRSGAPMNPHASRKPRIRYR